MNKEKAQEKTPKRQRFRPAEDKKLKQLVIEAGSSIDWEQIAYSLGNGRTVRQCRERFKNYLSPKLKKSPWSPEEDALLLDKFKELGPRWCQMMQFFSGRSSTNIKNHCATLLRQSGKIAHAAKKKMHTKRSKTQALEKREIDLPIFEITWDHLFDQVELNCNENEFDLLGF